MSSRVSFLAKQLVGEHTGPALQGELSKDADRNEPSVVEMQTVRMARLMRPTRARARAMCFWLVVGLGLTTARAVQCSLRKG